MPKANSRGAQVAGLVVAGTGLAHFVRPELFEPITVAAFPKDTRKHIFINGSIETAIGLSLIAPKTRKLALAGTVGYLAYLAGNAVRNR